MRFPFDEDEDYGDNGNELGSVVNPSNINLSNIDLNFLDANMPVGSGLFDIEGNINIENAFSLLNSSPGYFEEFAKLFPEDAALLSDIALPTKQGFKEYVSQDPSGLTEPPKSTGAEGAGFPGEGIKSGVKEWDDAAKKAGVELTDPNASTGIKKILEDLKKGFKDLTGLDAGDAAKYAAIIAAMKMAYDDAERARKEAKGTPFKSSSGISAVTGPGGVTGFRRAAQGGVMSIADGVQPMYLGGPTDGMADQVPAHIDNKRPAALSDGEFVIPADVVSHLGNGNSNAGAKRLYKMMDDVREARTGNTKQGRQINPNKFMPR